MRARTASAVVTQAVAIAAFVLSVWKDNPWTAAVAAVVFVFVVFPRWRGKLFRLVEQTVTLVAKAISKFRHDRCDYP